MAIIGNKFLGYLSETLTGAMNSRDVAYMHDQLFALLQELGGFSLKSRSIEFSPNMIQSYSASYTNAGIFGVLQSYCDRGILNQFVDSETERQVIALKQGFPHLPATSCSIIMQGFGKDLTERDVLAIYASHGLTRGMKALRHVFDFTDINRRIESLAAIVGDDEKKKEFMIRYNAIQRYLFAGLRKRESTIRACGITRSLFFHYWKRFCCYGLLGLADTGGELFRRSKIGMGNEAKIVINKVQYPLKKNSRYVKQLQSKDVVVDPSTVSKIFRRWNVKNFRSKFIDTLARLDDNMQEDGQTEELKATTSVVRYVEAQHLVFLQGMTKYGMATDAPGLFALWAYIEELGIFPALANMELTVPENAKGYSWFDLFMLNLCRIFYGIPSYTATCEHPDPSPAFFSGLVKPPCNDSFLNGLESKITEKQVYKLRQWLVKRAYDLSLIDMKSTAFDFHQIDLDVILGRLRKFGKGPSSKKKICYNGFRPHIAWDVGTGCLVAAEFRKSSARGTSTVGPFMKDYMLNEFEGIFETVYIDSEYTGKNVWQFILDKNSVGANLTACLKQNSFVKKARDLFLTSAQNKVGFWRYYDDDHVYSSKTFELNWENQSRKSEKSPKKFTLKCVVKKNISNGKLRCFGTSKHDLSSDEILQDYSKRWIIENGIKDLINSYFLDNCPGTRPHLADIHFLTISVCRIIYKMIETDMGDDIKNPDGTVKTLARMREFLFRQGAGKIFYINEEFRIEFSTAYSPEMTTVLKRLYRRLQLKFSEGLKLLGGARLNFSLAVPYGDEYRNTLQKVPLSVNENI